MCANVITKCSRIAECFPEFLWKIYITLLLSEHFILSRHSRSKFSISTAILFYSLFISLFCISWCTMNCNKMRRNAEIRTIAICIFLKQKNSFVRTIFRSISKSQANDWNQHEIFSMSCRADRNVLLKREQQKKARGGDQIRESGTKKQKE